MLVNKDNHYQLIFDKHYSVKCPHCSITASLSATSIPRFELLVRLKPEKVGIGYICNSCKEPVFLKFLVEKTETSNVYISDSFEEVEFAQETFELQYLPEEVAQDFKEALDCYSMGCWNAFAAMSRRTIQTSSSVLGSEGNSKVQNQISDLKEMGVVDEETFEQLKTIIISGHDGAHPHLPKLEKDRASVLLQLMKDVLYQLFVRVEKIKEANSLRLKAIQDKSNS
ncbi:MAG: DUF4145 domain-containing protein [Trueperaceae bacterium]|nr:DUF4145 domain-containing protein [Trueperaceae bacterium]